MKAKVLLNGVRIYERDTDRSPIIGSVDMNNVLDIEAEYGEWVKLTSGGWVKACYTEAIEVSGGGAAASEPVVFTLYYDDFGDPRATCNKTYDECAADFDRKQYAAYLTVPQDEDLFALIPVGMVSRYPAPAESVYYAFITGDTTMGIIVSPTSVIISGV